MQKEKAQQLIISLAFESSFAAKAAGAATHTRTRVLYLQGRAKGHEALREAFFCASIAEGQPSLLQRSVQG